MVDCVLLLCAQARAPHNRPTAMQYTRHILAAVLLLLSAVAADVQVHLHGRVIEDTSEQPIVNATVVLQDARGRRLARQITDETGRFSFAVRGSGPVRLQAERMGYRRTVTPILHFDGYTVYNLEVRLDIEAVLLAPLEVVARSRSGVSATMAGFDQRRRSGIGWFMTREEIERRKPSMVTDILAMVPGVWLQSSGGASGRTVYMARGRNCPAQIYIDGFHINRNVPPMPVSGGHLSTTEAFPIDDMIRPGSVEGIEVYQGLSRVPAEFLTGEAACGVVAIWTRRGG